MCSQPTELILGFFFFLFFFFFFINPPLIFFCFFTPPASTSAKNCTCQSGMVAAVVSGVADCFCASVCYFILFLCGGGYTRYMPLMSNFCSTPFTYKLYADELSKSTTSYLHMICSLFQGWWRTSMRLPPRLLLQPKGKGTVMPALPHRHIHVRRVMCIGLLNEFLCPKGIYTKQ